MPEQETVERGRRAKQEGKAPTTQAGEFIGLSKARRAGVKLPPAPATAKPETRKSAEYTARAAARGPTRPARTRSRAIIGALKREPRAAASRQALARQARSAAQRRTAAERRATARKAVQTKGPAGRKAAARKAARTRAAHAS
jgi:hypothetical protein